jgi:hypothetical protein
VEMPLKAGEQHDRKVNRCRNDGFVEIDDGSEDATLQTLLGQLGKVAFHGIEPGARCRREVEDEALVPVEPGAHLRMLVRCVVGEDEMDDFSGRNLGVDGVQKADELLINQKPAYFHQIGTTEAGVLSISQFDP